jgi:hypothetical protein
MALKQLEKTLSGEIYLRRQEGPWLPNLKKIIDSMRGKDLEVDFKNKIPYVSIKSNYNLEISFDEDALSIILKSIERYGKMNDAKIKSAAYLTESMKYILRQEKAGKSMLNATIIYKDKITLE